MSVRISLIFPFFQERGHTTEVIASWVRQTLAADRFELILVAGNDTAIDPAIVTLLRPHDRLLRTSFANLAEQYDIGIRTATGELFFLTESHCVPAADCLEAIDRFLAERPRLAGACIHSIPSCENAYARIDAATFDEGYRVFIQDGDWRKLNVHGFAMKRDIYLALGGFAHHCGRYAEMLLGAAIRDSGYELGYAHESAVTHHYRGNLQELIDGIDDYVRGESIYRAEHHGPDRVGFSYLPDVPDPYSPGAAALNREVATGLLTSVLGGSTPAVREGLYAVLRVLSRQASRRGPVLLEWLATAAARLRCWWNRNDAARLDAPYRDLIRRATKLSRVRWFGEQQPVDRPLPHPVPSLAIDSLPDWALHGFHGVEWLNGERFRWSGRVAALRLPLARGQYRLRLVTRGLRPAEVVKLRIAINGTRIEPMALPNGDYEVPIERWHCRSDVQTLLLMSDPLCPWRHGVMDHRELGVPLFAIDAIPAIAGIASPRRVAA